jgi:hypothetical protein
MSKIEDWIENEERYAKHMLGGDTPTPRQWGEHFLRMSPHDRASKLTALDNALDESSLTARSAGRVHSIRGALIRANRLASFAHR